MSDQFYSPPRRIYLAPALIAFVVLGAFEFTNADLRAGESTTCKSLPRPQDQVWLVSSRGLGCGNVDAQVAHLRYWRYDREHSWTKSALPDLLATDDANVITTVFIHGNRIPWDEAFTKGWRAYRALVSHADERPIRFIIWSWPSEPVRGPINDARVKASRTDPASYYVGWFLDQLSPNVPVSFWAHSLGARIATGAMHLLGGGTIAGHQLKQRLHPERQPMQVVLLAAALDDHWLLPGHCHGHALSQTASMLLVNNGCDALLRRYHLLYADRGREQALGYVGLASWCLPASDASKVEQTDASYQVGKQHFFDRYIESPHLVSRMRSHLLFEARKNLAGPKLETADTADSTPAVSLAGTE